MAKENNSKRPLVSLLTTEFIERIIEEAKDVLEKTGVWVENKEGLELLGNNDAQIDRGKSKAFIPRRLVEQTLKSVPSSITLYDRNGNPHMNLEGNNIYFEPACAAIKVWDSDLNKIREPVTQDTIDHFRLVDALDNIDSHGGGVIPTDVPKEIGDRFRVFLTLRHSTKPITNAGTFSKSGFQVEKDLLVAIRGSEKALRDKPLFVIGACPSPPLKWSDLTCHDLIRCAENGIPYTLISMPLTGSTAPITIGGSLVQHTAETLSGVVISQLTSRGAPIIWGGSPSAFDMRFGTTPMGAIETMMIDMAYNEIGKYLGIPTQAFIGLSDAKCPDSQAGLESGIGTILAALAGINIITGPGMLNFESTQCLEKLVIDNEICGMARRLVQGITPRGEPLAEDLFTEGLYEGKHFLLSLATMKWFRQEFFYPGPVISREDDQVWMEKGSTTAEQRAKEEVKRILATHQPEPLDKDVDRELVEIMTRDAQKYGMSKLPLL
ncbi:MAG TPA: trimethylamine methyltransferase family protein [Dehalococcoidales bacterium]|nr:trimethylamine methyltransferase family protein [Dehalococcoidales bacterium]